MKSKMTKIYVQMLETLRNAKGQGLVEYALLLGVIVVAIIAASNYAGVNTGITNAIAAIVAKLP